MSQEAPQLRREVGVFGAMMMGMGSIIGTGVFVSIGIGAEVAGPSVLVAIGLASLVAICNGLSSAQLAANHPVSGGTYEYGYRWLNPRWGFTAGWMFMCAKSASAATAALGFAGYLVYLLKGVGTPWLLPIALLVIAVLTVLVLGGIKRSNLANIVIVSITLLTLAFFVVVGLPFAVDQGTRHLRPFMSIDSDGVFGLLQATALMFVAYTGYGRIATLGEEVKEPERTIPRAVIATLVASMLIYLSVALVALACVGAEEFANATREQVAPLQIIAGVFAGPTGQRVLAVGALTAMLGVLLNLLLGLSRVLLAMGRRGDAPRGVATVGKSGSPWVAILVVGAIISGLVLLADVRLTWSFSAFTVLIYYAITNWCALKLRPEQRLFPIWPAYCGLVSCGLLAFWVDWKIWLTGLGLIAAAFAWHWVVNRKQRV